jgi:hypothetical protein
MLVFLLLFESLNSENFKSPNEFGFLFNSYDIPQGLW